MGIDEKYGPVCISLIRENIEKMAVFGHPKELTKGGTNKYQYRIILRTTDVSYFGYYSLLLQFLQRCTFDKI